MKTAALLPGASSVGLNTSVVAVADADSSAYAMDDDEKSTEKNPQMFLSAVIEADLMVWAFPEAFFIFNLTTE